MNNADLQGLLTLLKNGGGSVAPGAGTGLGVAGRHRVVGTWQVAGAGDEESRNLGIRMSDGGSANIDRLSAHPDSYIQNLLPKSVRPFGFLSHEPLVPHVELRIAVAKSEDGIGQGWKLIAPRRNAHQHRAIGTSLQQPRFSVRLLGIGDHAAKYEIRLGRARNEEILRSVGWEAGFKCGGGTISALP